MPRGYSLQHYRKLQLQRINRRYVLLVLRYGRRRSGRTGGHVNQKPDTADAQDITERKTIMTEIKVYTVDEVAELLQVTRTTVYAYIKSGKLKAKKIGKYYRITEENLRAFLDD